MNARQRFHEGFTVLIAVLVALITVELFGANTPPKTYGERILEQWLKLPENGFGPLHQAAADGNISAARQLLASGVSVDVTTEQGETALFWAVRGGQKEMAEFLLQSKANVNAVAKNGATCLSWAIVGAGTNIVSVLLDHGADPNLFRKDATPPIVSATSRNMAPTVVALLAAGANVNAAENGDTALHRAVRNNNKVLVQLLLRSKPDLQLQDHDHKTALELARQFAGDDIIQMIGKEVGVSAAAPPSETERKLLSWYRDFDAVLRKGTLSQIRGALLAQQPTFEDVQALFLKHTNAVWKACQARRNSFTADWQRRGAYDRPTEPPTRIEILATNNRVLKFYTNGWLSASAPIYRLNVWRNGRAAPTPSLCFINDHWIALTDDILVEDSNAVAKSAKPKSKSTKKKKGSTS
jgi:ankyrin repeat protein